MELEELRRRLTGSTPVRPSSPEMTSLQPEKAASITTAFGQLSPPKMNQPFENGGPSLGNHGPDNKGAAATKTSGEESKKAGEPMLQQASEALAISEPLDAKYKLAEAVDKVFRPVETFREHFMRLAQAFESVEDASEGTLNAFRNIGDLHNHLVELGKTFQLVEAFTVEIGKVAKNFEPMRPLHAQLTQLNESFYINLLGLAQALQPVEKLKIQTAKLFGALDHIGELQAKLNEVAKSLRRSAVQTQEHLTS